jgi:ABC-type branched-subunit amino acid transport system substrate-binding protein
MRSTSRSMGLVALGALIVAAIGAVACGSPGPASAASGNGPVGSDIPSSAFNDHTGVTAHAIRVANVSTLAIGGLFKGALVGTEAYLAMVNSSGGVNGRKITVESTDDGFTGAGNKQGIQNAINNDFALVGGFSAQDSFGGSVLAKNPGMPDVSVIVDVPTSRLPNVVTPVPLPGGWEEGPLQYFKKKFPKGVDSVGTIISAEPAGLSSWAGEKYALQKVGYKVVYVHATPETQTDFTANVIAMKDAGVKLLFLDQLPEIYTAAILKSLAQQSYHPQVILGAGSYSNSLVSNAGGAGNVDGAAVNQNSSFYLGQDSALIPSIATFNKWVGIASPGFKADIFSFYGWLSAELFTQGLRNAGSDPSRGSLLRALSKITSFSGDNIEIPVNPVAKTVSNCYILGQIENGNYQRVDDPPVASSTHGYRCDYAYITPPHS